MNSVPRIAVGCLVSMALIGPSRGALAAVSHDETLSRAQALYDELEYESVVPLATTVLASNDATVQQRVDAYVLVGSSLVIVGNPVDAENTFRLLLRAMPNFEMPETTSPKVRYVFQSVKLQEDKVRAEADALEHRRLIESLGVDNVSAHAILGGDPLVFSFRVTDPRGGVAKARVEYRRQGASEYSVATLASTGQGRWVAELPPQTTENEGGMVLEYSLTIADKDGNALLQLGAAPDTPFTMNISKGTVAGRIPLYRKVWFWAAAGAAVVASGTAVAITYRNQTKLPDSDLGAVSVK